ncbi:hypothetical protein BGP75_20985 [Motiliproteus sp. MSK22-1]|nr:hypothetical protein BGP75_20985 [Motiliproteus sp. MSK22-1]
MLFLFFPLFSVAAQAESADQLFQQFSESIVQVKVIDIASESKSAIGSGFLVAEGNVIATNYHVISALLNKPDRYRIEIEYMGARYNQLQLLDVDVVNDLALLYWQGGSGNAFQLADSMPRQGEPIYSFGNPMDIGMTVVPGTYNGIKETSFFQRVHLTASINPGMSGGPALNSAGEVVGINVSTAGNQISFLVPIERLKTLLDQQHKRLDSPIDLESRIRQQLHDVQEQMFSQLIENPWQEDQLGAGQIVGEMAPFVVCWGDSDTGQKTGLRTISKGCHSDNYIYMGTHFNTGFFEYEFTYLETEELSSWTFYSALERALSGARPGNRASREDVTNFQCNNDFYRAQVKSGADTVYKATFCSRQYKNYPKLYDVFYIAATINRKDQALVSHFTLAGVEQELAMKFTEKFIGSVGWK